MDVKVFSLRLPEDVYKGLKALAEKENRSLNQQIVYIIRKYLAQNKEPNKA